MMRKAVTLLLSCAALLMCPPVRASATQTVVPGARPAVEGLRTLGRAIGRSNERTARAASPAKARKGRQRQPAASKRNGRRR